MSIAIKTSKYWPDLKSEVCENIVQFFKSASKCENFSSVNFLHFLYKKLLQCSAVERKNKSVGNILISDFNTICYFYESEMLTRQD